MSQKSPKSPKSPVSNSTSCDDIVGTGSEENRRPKSALDRLQRQVEEELRQSNMLLVTIDGLIAESKGSISGSHSRPRSAQNEGNVNPNTSRISVESEICSPLSRAMSNYDEEVEELKLPSPPQSIITYGSRGRDKSQDESKGGTRVPSPESFSLKSRTRSPSKLTNQDSSSTDHHHDETRDLSSAVYVPSREENRDLPSRGGGASRRSHHTPQEQLSVAENRYRNESIEPRETQPASCHGRGTRSSSPAFASARIKEITAAKSSQSRLNICMPSVTIRPEPRFPMYDEDVRSARTGNDFYRSNESPYNFLGRDDKAKAALDHLSQLKKTPSYFRCGLQQGTQFLNVCCPKIKDARRAEGKVVRLPKMPCLKSEDIDDLIRCETHDVESTWYLTSDERKINKKPCPKQQKAQLTVKSLVQTYTTQTGGIQIYSPLEHPDPEDISPEVAAAVMFSQEQGIGMEECPNVIIRHLFPDEPKSTTSEKVREGSISVVDPNQKDREEMIEKSAAVPSEGVSDSAYTRIMREKGEDMKFPRSYDMDFAICQSKPEYVLVAQKPQRISKVQFRGNSHSWFPGYFSAFPDDEGLKVVSSPSGLFHKAWFYSNPKNIPANDIIVLE